MKAMDRVHFKLLKRHMSRYNNYSLLFNLVTVVVSLRDRKTDGRTDGQTNCKVHQIPIYSSLLGAKRDNLAEREKTVFCVSPSVTPVSPEVFKFQCNSRINQEVQELIWKVGIAGRCYRR